MPSLLDENATLNDGLGEGVSYRLPFFNMSTINSSEEQLHIDVEAKTQNAANHHRGELLVAVKTEISNSIDTAPR